MCKIARFREQLARAQASYTRRGCPVCGQHGFLCTLLLQYSRSDQSSPLRRSSLSCLVQPARRSRRKTDPEPKTTSLGVSDH